MRPTQLLLIGLLATTSSATWAADGSERPQQVREAFLASQEQIHGDANQETAATSSTGKAPRDASAPTTAEEDI
ncbi:hypothetical protein SAMN03159355_02051 [Pseudomonas sp. NFPP10]|uniref:hypothetical protein n=1 Tax=Pseudomonas TaxID=286 RepID=UPI00088784B9|nr:MULTISPECIES: hypothetical protein [Pseudomonas]POA82632.1 hypothetical protein C1883_27750 [Pseudomonas protegens]PZP03676.1 MAG: hypothetical protein DI621_26800 [Pseudomonas protegens]ROM19013.1 hypothetical protein BK643_09045 [Pseudomonas protegens]UVM10119.1 hypothetical protein LOY29_26425 [Pseudomonas protegens]SDA19977.1 hypothetical protein SAMN03159465_02518 [Pseudomonas sp. NFPP12]